MKNTRRIISAVLAALMALSLAACGNANSTPDAERSLHLLSPKQTQKKQQRKPLKLQKKLPKKLPRTLLLQQLSTERATKYQYPIQ